MEPSRRFYRVQSDSSFTIYDEQDGFAAQGQYLMDYSHWLNKGKIMRHLNWSDRSEQGTPFISVFNNLEDADRRAQSLVSRNRFNVFIAEILLPEPRASFLEIKLSDEEVRLPVLTHRDREGTTAFFSTANARKHFKVDVQVSQRSEWLALGAIPRSMFDGIRPYN